METNFGIYVTNLIVLVTWVVIFVIFNWKDRNKIFTKKTLLKSFVIFLCVGLLALCIINSINGAKIDSSCYVVLLSILGCSNVNIKPLWSSSKNS